MREMHNMNNVSWIPPLVGAVVVWIVSVAQYMLGSRPRPTSHGVAAAGWSQVAKVFRYQGVELSVAF